VTIWQKKRYIFFYYSSIVGVSKVFRTINSNAAHLQYHICLIYFIKSVSLNFNLILKI
jgi:hypothetical protein